LPLFGAIDNRASKIAALTLRRTFGSPRPQASSTIFPVLNSCRTRSSVSPLIVQRYYRATSRELKRLDSVARSPIFTHFTDTLEGASTIRAFSAGDRFLRRNLVLIDDNQRVRRRLSSLDALRVRGPSFDSDDSCRR
jgi:ABC-type multidrug transport system fused ATPase/permease subunit